MIFLWIKDWNSLTKNHHISTKVLFRRRRNHHGHLFSGKKKKHPLNRCKNSQLILEWRMALALSEKLASILHVIKGFNYTNRAGPTHKPEKKVYLTRNASKGSFYCLRSSSGMLKNFTSNKNYDVNHVSPFFKLSWIPWKNGASFKM